MFAFRSVGAWERGYLGRSLGRRFPRCTIYVSPNPKQPFSQSEDCELFCYRNGDCFRGFSRVVFTVRSLNHQNGRGKVMEWNNWRTKEFEWSGQCQWRLLWRTYKRDLHLSPGALGIGVWWDIPQEIRCTLYHILSGASIPKPVGPPNKKSVQLMAGEGAAISCKVPMEPDTKLGICFAPVGENLTSLNHSKSCVECEPYSEGVCKGSIVTKPGWQVARSSSNTAACMPYQITNLTIPKVQESDRGTVYCYWSTSSEVGNVYQMNTITVFSNSWIDQNWKYLLVGAVGVALVLVLLLGVVSIIHCYVSARRKRIKKLMDVADYPAESVRGGSKRHTVSSHNTGSHDLFTYPCAYITAILCCYSNFQIWWYCFALSVLSSNDRYICPQACIIWNDYLSAFLYQSIKLGVFILLPESLCSLVTRLSPRTNDGKLGGAWEHGYCRVPIHLMQFICLFFSLSIYISASIKRNPNPRRGKARKMSTNWSQYPG